MWSIRRRLTRHLLAVFGVLTSAALALAAGLITHALQKTFDSDLNDRAAAIASLTEIVNDRVSFDFSPDFLREYDGAGRAERFFELGDSAGNSLRRSPSLGDAHLIGPAPGPLSHSRFHNLHLPDHHHVRVLEKIFSPELETPAEKPRQVSLVLAADRSKLDREVTAVWSAAAAGALISLLVIAFTVPRVLRRGLASLEDLSAKTQKIDAHSLATRVQIEAFPAELQPIGAALNELFRRLEVSFARERRFSADLSHELRTPIAELRNLAECARKWPDTRAESHDRDVLEIALQMETLVSRMLILARLETEEPTGAPGIVQLEEVVSKTCASFSAACRQRSLRFEVRVVPLRLSADAVLLKMILQNLWDNAVEHSDAPGEIVVVGHRSGREYALSISNQSALSASDVAHLFEPFWRKDASRTDSVRHSGLGLSLAQRAAARLGWVLSAGLSESGRVAFTLTIPMVDVIS